MNEENEIPNEVLLEKKEKIKYCIKQILLYTTMITFVALSIWFMIWVTRELSYHFVYENKVKQTIIEMVKPETLKEQ